MQVIRLCNGDQMLHFSDTISRIGLPRKVAILRYKQMFSKITKEKAIEDIEYDLRKRISDRACSIEYPVKIYSLQPYGKCNIARGYGEAVVVNFSEYQGNCIDV